ncbi:MAG TPA: ethanolamine ammonia-lyase subunit EutC [Parasulfuritortus sp.]
MAGRDLTTPDPWRHLRSFTRARIALGRAGDSLPTDEILGFGYAHALARDAVHRPLDLAALADELKQSGFDTLNVRSAAPDRSAYLLRPDLGRELAPDSADTLRTQPEKGWDLVAVVGDGLSSLAVGRHARPLLERIRAALPQAWRFGPVVLASQARVALGDPVGELLQAKMVAVLIGERPGLTSPDSLGLYLTHAPKTGCQDSARNCISNIRPEGLGYDDAARKTVWLAKEGMRLGLTGVGLKDRSDQELLGAPGMLATSI